MGPRRVIWRTLAEQHTVCQQSEQLQTVSAFSTLYGVFTLYGARNMQAGTILTENGDDIVASSNE